MSGLDSSTTPIRTETTLRKTSSMIESAFDNGRRFSLSCEFLRVHSPLAEARGRGA
jgi:DUF971 family protein